MMLKKRKTGRKEGGQMSCVHIYCGEGKGKTTAAVGLAVRLAGSGGRAVIVRFLKNDNSGEVAGLRQIEGVTVIPCEKSFGFTWQMSDEQKREAAEVYALLLERAAAESMQLCQSSDKPVLLVLDEVCAAVSSGLLSERAVTDLLDARPENLEVVLTGRAPADGFLKRADYISQIEKVRHPFDDGLAARKGTEY